MVSNQEKVMIIRKKKCCKPRKIKVCKKKSQKISTHLLTVLIIRVIVHTEQRKKEKKKSFRMFQITKTSPQRNKPQW